jgi:Glycosyltransferase family 87
VLKDADAGALPPDPPLTGRARLRRMAWLFGLIVAVRIVYFMVMASHYSADWDPQFIQRNGFLSIARYVAHGEGFVSKDLLTYYSVGHLIPTAARSPFPIVVFAGAVLIFGSHTYYPLLLFTWCLSGVVGLCAYWVAARASGREWLALWTGVAFAFYLSEMFVMTTYSMASEPLFAACLAVYVVLLIRTTDRPGPAIALAAGAMLGLATLSRPTVLLLPVVSIGWILYRLRGRGLAMSVAFAIAFAAVQVPWVVRNYRAFGTPVATSTLGGFNLYRHNAMIAEGKYHTGYSHPEMERRIRRLTAATGRPLESFNEAELDALLKAEGTRIIRQYPLRYLKLSAMRTVWIWYNENSGRGLYAVENFLLYLFALGGLFYVLRSREPVYFLLLAHIAYFVAFHSLINVQYRFVCPIMPYMILLAGLPVFAWRYGRVSLRAPAKAASRLPHIAQGQ